MTSPVSVSVSMVSDTGVADVLTQLIWVSVEEDSPSITVACLSYVGHVSDCVCEALDKALCKDTARVSDNVDGASLFDRVW